MAGESPAPIYPSVVLVSVFLVAAGVIALSGAESYAESPLGWLIIAVMVGAIAIGLNGLKNTWRCVYARR